jgi:hypothetical protein
MKILLCLQRLVARVPRTDRWIRGINLVSQRLELKPRMPTQKKPSVSFRSAALPSNPGRSTDPILFEPNEEESSPEFVTLSQSLPSEPICACCVWHSNTSITLRQEHDPPDLFIYFRRRPAKHATDSTYMRLHLSGLSCNRESSFHDPILSDPRLWRHRACTDVPDRSQSIKNGESS